MISFIFAVLCIILPVSGITGSPADYEIGNARITRTLTLQNDSLFSTSLLLHADCSQFITKSRNFSFRVNDKLYSGFSGWRLLGKTVIRDSSGGSGLCLRLAGCVPPTRFRDRESAI
ncbi:MAG: hypothetical protein U5R06_24635 [candidate division KSB1 bacterium]|nr:hypothetical protein [candidate division KSB1 bacterium]